MYFHGPAYQVVGAAWRDGDRSVAELAGDLPANHAPEGQTVLAAPRLIELCFQAAGLWEAGREGRMALPTHVDRVVVLDPAGESGDGPLVVAARQGESGFECTVTGPSGNVAVRLEGYRTVELPVPLPDRRPRTDPIRDGGLRRPWPAHVDQRPGPRPNPLCPIGGRAPTRRLRSPSSSTALGRPGPFRPADPWPSTGRPVTRWSRHRPSRASRPRRRRSRRGGSESGEVRGRTTCGCRVVSRPTRRRPPPKRVGSPAG